MSAFLVPTTIPNSVDRSVKKDEHPGPIKYLLFLWASPLSRGNMRSDLVFSKGFSEHVTFVQRYEVSVEVNPMGC